MSVPIVNKGKVEQGGTPDSPKHGERVLHCGHMLRQKKHCMYTPVAITYHIKGVARQTHWAIVCDDCYRKVDGDPTKIKLVGEGQYDKHGMGNSRPPNPQAS